MDEQNITREQAKILWERAYRYQMKGELGDAIQLYKRSIETYPTAEAYTFLGWAYSMLGLLDRAIALCKQAIEVDPAFGNPYNDIGAYLMEQGRWEEAISWLEQATAAPRYASPEFAYMNLGRVYTHQGDVKRALTCFDQALAEAPLYLPATWAKYTLLGVLN